MISPQPRSVLFESLPRKDHYSSLTFRLNNFLCYPCRKDARVEVPGSVGPTFRNTWGGDGFVHAMPVKSILRALGRQ